MYVKEIMKITPICQILQHDKGVPETRTFSENYINN